jgi:hypothetical protein
VRDEVMSTAKYNYDRPVLAYWNEVEAKLDILAVAKQFGIVGDIDVDNGNSFSYQVSLYFPKMFYEQTIMSQFLCYDVTAATDLNRRAQVELRVAQGFKQFIKTDLDSEFLTSIEKSLFGEFS